jgi:glycosyltransferase involved in cell wall biosynthesis
MKICILTSVHSAFDTRIFHKQAKTLAGAGYEVTLIAQHSKDEVVNRIRIIALPKSRNRFWRMLGTWRVLRLAFKQKADVYHFHDPELLPTGVLLKLFRKGKIIYDVHENVKWDIITKTWLPKTLRRPLSLMYRLTEKFSFPLFDEIIIAEDSYIENYRNRNNISVIRNYPLLSYVGGPAEVKTSTPTLVYVGGISEPRGVLELIDSIRLLKPKYEKIVLTLVGQIYSKELDEKIRKSLKKLGLQDNVRLAGKVKHEEIYSILPRYHIGMVILYPEPNFIESLPTKLLEYMATGLPVIASNFPLWNEFVEENNCGLTVDPLNPEGIAQAVEYLIEHPNEARKMGENGRKAVIKRYNWEKESQKLIGLYENLLKRSRKKQ